MKIRLTVICLCLCAPLLAASDEIDQAYERARNMLPAHLKGMVKNETIQAHWFAGGQSFWYKRDAGIGFEYVIADALKGDKRKAFDHQRLVDAVREVVGADSVVDPDHLPVMGIKLQNEGLEISLAVGAQTVLCQSPEYACTAHTASSPAMNLLPSPDGRSVVFTRENNLWLKSLQSDQERQLTRDGEAYFGWGIRPEQQRFDEIRKGQARSFPPAATFWSPDSSKLIAQRMDERQVLSYPFVEMAPQDGGHRPSLYSIRVELLGDAARRENKSFIIDTGNGSQKLIKLQKGFGFDYFGAGNTPVGWSPDASKAFMLATNAGAKTVQLVEVILATGEARVLIEEKSATSVTLNHGVMNPNVRILGSGTEAIWFSERDGWGHLYLYDLASGEAKTPITSGDWGVWDIVHIDESRRQVFFTAGGRESGRDPYYRHLYKASLDGGGVTLLTPENADHDIKTGFTPAGQRNLAGVTGDKRVGEGAGFFIDSYSTVKQAPISVLRSLDDGRLISQLEKADASRLFAVGWKIPERFSVKAADGQTDIRGVLYLPSDFDKTKAYPVIDAIYGGPVSLVAARSFRDAYDSGYYPASVAELGFAVIVLDGRGTPHRSRAFREAGFGSFADPQLEDHIAAIRQLSQKHAFLDISRVGIYGHSNGGYLSARALLKHPDFFKVGFASAGPQNFQGLPGTGAPWFGVPDYGEGATLRPESSAVPDNYKVLDNSNYADQLQGRLMLVCGELDYTAFPALTMQLASALIEANKAFDMLYLPGSTHRYFIDEPYVTRRLWDYFTEHLAGMAPPEDFDLSQ